MLMVSAAAVVVEAAVVLGSGGGEDRGGVVVKAAGVKVAGVIVAVEYRVDWRGFEGGEGRTCDVDSTESRSGLIVDGGGEGGGDVDSGVGVSAEGGASSEIDARLSSVDVGANGKTVDSIASIEGVEFSI